MKPSPVLRIVFLSISLGCVGPSFSQSSTGTISGTVTDQNNAVVVGATVVGRNTETGFVRSVVTNSSGLYRLTDIPSGRYEITIEAESFKKHTRKDITVDVTQNANVDAVLQLGAIEDSVTINENASTDVASLNCRSHRTVVSMTYYCLHPASSSSRTAKRLLR